MNSGTSGTQYPSAARVLLILLFFTPHSYARQNPKITISALQVVNAEHVEVRGTGFTADRHVISHLRRPDGTESSILQFLTNEHGEFFHSINTLLLSPGIHELWVVDQRSNAVSNTVQFSVGFDEDSPPFAEAQEVIARYIGVWRGSGARNSPPVPSTILISITGRNGGAVGGTVAYPSLSCGAMLTFRTVYSDAIEFQETSTYGTERCAENGVVKIKLAQDGSLLFEWRDLKLPGIATGKLTAQK